MILAAGNAINEPKHLTMGFGSQPIRICHISNKGPVQSKAGNKNVGMDVMKRCEKKQ